MPVDSRYYQAEQARARGRRDAQRAGQWQTAPRAIRPGGRGVRDRATLLAEALLGASAATIANKTIESAVSGDGVNQRFLLARIPRAALRRGSTGVLPDFQMAAAQVEASRLRGTAAECCKSVAAFPLHLQRGTQKSVFRRRPNPASGRRQTAAHLAEICGSA